MFKIINSNPLIYRYAALLENETYLFPGVMEKNETKLPESFKYDDMAIVIVNDKSLDVRIFIDINDTISNASYKIYDSKEIADILDYIKKNLK